MAASPTQTPSAAGREAGLAAWTWAMRDLPDLPCKAETNARGQLLLSPPEPEHRFSQSSIARRLHDALGPSTATEFAVQTAGGVKVPDVVWISGARRAKIPEGAEASPVMPELCVEVLSASNTDEEMAEKRRLYFDGGTAEVWLVATAHEIRFFDADAPRDSSPLAPDFPNALPD